MTSIYQEIETRSDDAEPQKTHEGQMLESQNKGLPLASFANSNKELNDISSRNDNVQHHMQVSVEFMDPDTVCGIGRFRPQWLQKYATANNYLILYCILGVLQGSYFSYLIGTMTTLEKRYAFKSKMGGAVMTVDEITPLVLGVIVGYFGGRMHRPRVLAVGMYLSSLCCFISALPYFLYGPSQNLVASTIKNDTESEFCEFSLKNQNCDEADRPPTLSAVACLFIGSFCKGFGSVAYYAVGMSYMDDNTKTKSTPLYFAAAEAMRLTGPIVGFVMSSAFLTFYEDPFGDPGYGSDDPRWIGAWWIGFVLQGVLLAIFTCPLFLFPKRLPKQKSRALSNTREFDHINNKQKILGMAKAVKRLLINPFYFLLVLGTLFSATAGFGMYMLLPKYMEVQFRLTAAEANILSGPPGLIAMQLTITLGGFVIWKWHPTVKQLLTGQAWVEIVWAVGMLTLIFPSCEHFEMRGTKTTEYGLLEVQNQCNMDCLCSTSSFTPVCGSDNKSIYFSPCHAGCPVPSNSSDMAISNCTCIYNVDGTHAGSDDFVRQGFCDAEGCWEQAIIYMAIFPILYSLQSTFCVAHLMMLLRCVEPQDKSIALGMFTAAMSAFAFIPNPVIYGALADSACLIWEQSCGKTGNCWYYDIDKLKYLIHGTAAAFSLAATVCFIVLCRKASIIPDLYKDVEEIPNGKHDIKEQSVHKT